MVDLAFFGEVGLAIVLLALTIVAIVNRDVWLPFLGRIVSNISGGWQVNLERARAQKARRERLYGWDAEPVLGQFGTSSSGGSTGSSDLVLGQQHQLEPQEPGESEPAREPTVRQLEKEELIVLLAVQRNADGGYLFSANQITAFVGGAAAPIKQVVAGVRGKKETPAPSKSVYRPLNGW